MNEIALWWIEFGQQQPFLAWLVATSLKITLIVCVGLAVATAMNRISASAKHLVWCCVAVAALILTPAGFLLPKLKLQVMKPVPAEPIVAPPIFASVPSSHVVHTRESTFASPDEATLPDSETLPLLADSNTDSAVTSHVAPANLADVESTNYGIAQSWNDLLTIGALWLYLSGLLYFATRLIVGALRLRAIAAQGQSLTENQTKTLEITARAIGLKTTPECLVCERTSVPLTFGITRPIIALPPSYLSWDTTTQQNCLLHEMAHIRRRDSGWRLVGLLACCVYWFHPLSHFVARRIRSTSEDATDDVVLQSGVPAARYASTILDVSVDAQTDSFVFAAAMATGPSTEARLNRILRSDVRRLTLNTPSKLLLLLAFALLGTLGVRLTALAEPPVPTQVTKSAVTKAASSEPSEDQSETSRTSPDLPSASSLPPATTFDSHWEQLAALPLVQSDPKGLRISLSGVVRDPDGQPVPNAIVALRERSSMRVNRQRMNRPVIEPSPLIINHVFARAKTDAHGRYQLTTTTPPIDQPGGLRQAVYRQLFKCDLFAASETGMIGWANFSISPSDWETELEQKVDVALLETETVTGKFVDSRGKPIVGATVIPLSHTSYSQQTARHILGVPNSAARLAAKTDRDGSFRLPETPAGTITYLSLHHPDRLPTIARVGDQATVDMAQAVESRGAPRPYPPLQSFPAMVRETARTIIHGRVIDQSGSPVPNARVSFARTMEFTQADGSGEFQWPMRDFVLDSMDDDGITSIHASGPQGMGHAEFTKLQLLDANSVQIAIKPTIELTGKILDKDTRHPIPNAEMLVRHSGRNHVYRTKGDGRFAFKIPAGVHEIVFRAAEGFRVLEPSRSVSLTKNTELEPFFVERLPKLNVRVIDAKGKIIPDATVTAKYMKAMSGSSYVRANRPPVRFERDIAEPSRTGKDGVASLTLKESDQQTVQLYASALLGGEKLFGTATTNTPTDDTVKISLSPGWKVKGRIVKDGAGVPDAKVVIQSTSFAGISGVVPFSTNRTVASARTDENGEYRFDVMAGGSYNVSLINDRTNRAVAQYGLSTRLHPIKQVTGNQFTVEPFDLTVANGIISGWVRSFDSTPIANVTVSVASYSNGKRPKRSIRTQTDASGRFELKNLDPGLARLLVRPQSASGFSGTTVYANVGRQGIRVRLDPHSINVPSATHSETNCASIVELATVVQQTNSIAANSEGTPWAQC